MNTTMNNQIVINQKSESFESLTFAVIAGYLALLNLPFVWLSRYYSRVLEEEVSVARTRKLVWAQISFVIMILPFDATLAFRTFGLVLFALSLLSLRQKKG